MFADGDKRLGKFIKNNSKLLPYISIKKFSFEELLESSPFFFDNPNSNVLYAKLHTNEDFNLIVKPHPTINKPLETLEGPKPIIQPLNFTDEWKKRNSKSHKRAFPEYEEDYDTLFDFKENINVEESIAEDKTQKDIQSAVPQHSSNINVDIKSLNDKTSNKTDKLDKLGAYIQNLDNNRHHQAFNNDVSEEKNFYDIQKQNLDHVAKTINEASKNLNDIANNTSYFKVTRDESLDSKYTDNTSFTNEQEDGFIPFNTQQIDNGENPEYQVAEHYKQQKKQEEISENLANNPKFLEQIEQIKAQAYEQGLKAGEEKIKAEIKEKFSQMMQEINNLVSQLYDLKKQVLNNVQDNFYEIAQAIAEGLLKREFQIDPDTFANILRQAIGQFVKSDDIKILIHPSYYQKLVELANIDDIKPLLVQDFNIEEGNFRIDSKLSTIDGNLKNLIANLFTKASTSLFEEEQTQDNNTNDIDRKESKDKKAV